MRMSMEVCKGKIDYVAYVRQKRLRLVNSVTLPMQKATMLKHDRFCQYFMLFIIILIGNIVVSHWMFGVKANLINGVKDGHIHGKATHNTIVYSVKKLIRSLTN